MLTGSGLSGLGPRSQWILQSRYIACSADCRSSGTAGQGRSGVDIPVQRFCSPAQPVRNRIEPESGCRRYIVGRIERCVRAGEHQTSPDRGPYDRDGLAVEYRFRHSGEVVHRHLRTCHQGRLHGRHSDLHQGPAGYVRRDKEKLLGGGRKDRDHPSRLFARFRARYDQREPRCHGGPETTEQQSRSDAGTGNSSAWRQPKGTRRSGFQGADSTHDRARRILRHPWASQIGPMANRMGG